MALITLFSAPKPFADPRIAMIQRNAVASWAQLGDVEVILMGHKAGLPDAARRAEVRYVSDVQRNDRGTPLISSMIRLARDHSASPILCIVNSDVILMSDFVDACRRVWASLEHFVLIGRRWDLDLVAPLDFGSGWEARLLARVRSGGILHRPAGSDLFAFPRACFGDVPDFAVGRAGWDNWMIYEARMQKWPVVDCTDAFTLVHQNHDYGHLPGGEPHYSAPESNENVRLAGGEAAIRYTVLDATHRLHGTRLVHPRPSYLRFMRGVELGLRAVFFFLPQDVIEEVARPKRWRKRIQRLLGMG